MSSNKDELRNTLDDKKENRKYKISIEEKNTKANIRFGTKLLIYLIIAGISGAFFSNLLIKIRYIGVIQQFEESILNNDMIILDYTKVIDIVSPSIVSISDKEENLLNKEKRDQNWTGVILNEGGSILTNYSAIKDLNEVYVRLNDDKDNPIKAKVLASKAENDLAIIKIEYDGEITPIKFADEESLKVGQEIVVLGNTVYGEGVSSVTPGIITSMHEGMGINNKKIPLMQINAPINQGNTGGAICNSKGELVGLASLELTKINNELGLFQGIELKALTSIINTTNIFKSVLGVSKGGIIYDKSKEFRGFYVQEVVKGGNAYKAGIKPTDIILEIGDEKVSTVEELTFLIQNKNVGDILKCKVLSDGETKNIDIKIEQ